MNSSSSQLSVRDMASEIKTQPRLAREGDRSAAPIVFMSESPLVPFYDPLGSRDLAPVAQLLGQLLVTLGSGLRRWWQLRRDERPHPSHEGAMWRFRLLQGVGLLIALPVVAVSRLLPDGRRAHRDESIFVESNRSVLTALGIAFIS